MSAQFVHTCSSAIMSIPVMWPLIWTNQLSQSKAISPTSTPKIQNLPVFQHFWDDFFTSIVSKFILRQGRLTTGPISIQLGTKQLFFRFVQFKGQCHSFKRKYLQYIRKHSWSVFIIVFSKMGQFHPKWHKTYLKAFPKGR